MEQKVIAAKLKVTQQAISKIEQSEAIDDKTLEKLATALGVTKESIENFKEDASINIIATTVNNHDQSASIFHDPVFNPIDKLLDIIEENKKLYERLLQSEREKVELLSAALKHAGIDFK